MNKPFTVLVGNATADPELRFTSAGHAYVTFSVAVNTRKKEGDKWVDGDTDFHNVVVWRDLAEHVAETVTKGMRVVCVGDLSVRSWETDEGDKRSKVELVAEEVSPSLRWATAVVTRITGSQQSYDKPATPAKPAAQPAWGDDEEPF